MSDPRTERDPTVDQEALPISTNPLGGRPIVPPRVVEADTPEEAPEAHETADRVKRASRNLPPGVDYTEPTVVNEATGEVLISEIQKETGVGGGVEPVPPGVIAKGGTAAINGSHPIMRSEAGVDAGDAMGALAPATVVLLLDGPQQVGDSEWWHVRAPDGRLGWVLGSALGATEG